MNNNNEVVMKNLTVTLENDKESYEITISSFLNKTIIQDLKCLLYFDLDKINQEEKFNINNILRDKIVLNQDLPNNTPPIITLTVVDQSKKIELGYFDVIAKNIIKPHKFEKIDDCLFEMIKEHNVDNYSGIWDNFNDKKYLKSYLSDYYKLDISTIIEKYICNGMFKLYYRMLVEEAKVNNKDKIEGKCTAMCTYLATKRVLNDFFDQNGYDLEVSNPNIFIKNVNVEYDAVIVKKSKDNREKFIYNENEVEAIIELKTSGCFLSKDDLKKNEFINYIIKSNPLRKKYIYLSLYVPFGDRDTSVHYYEYLLCNIAAIKDRYTEYKESYGIFCATKRNQKKFLIPYEYDLEAILNKIFK